MTELEFSQTATPQPRGAIAHFFDPGRTSFTLKVRQTIVLPCDLDWVMVVFMRTSRLLGSGRSFYHVISRVVDRAGSSRPATRRSSARSSATGGLHPASGSSPTASCRTTFTSSSRCPTGRTLAPLDEEGLLAVTAALRRGDGRRRPAGTGTRPTLGKRGLAPRDPRPLTNDAAGICRASSRS